MFKFREREELKEENKKLKKENEELRHAVTNAVKRNDELWNSLNVAASQMYAFVKVVPDYIGNHSLEGPALTRWANKFDEQYKAYEDRLFHSEYKGLHKCGDERYWFK